MDKIEARRFYDYWRKTKFKSSRDQVFQIVINGFNGAPVRILDIGGIRGGAPHYPQRYSDGWSSFFWADYILKNGGRLEIIDSDPDVIANTRKVLGWFDGKISLHLHVALGEKFLASDNKFDLVYLDGGNDHDAMLAQYELCLKSSVVLTDDLAWKGRKLIEKYKDFVLFQFARGHQQVLYYPNVLASTINVEEPEEVVNWQGWCFFDNFDSPEISDRIKNNQIANQL